MYRSNHQWRWRRPIIRALPVTITDQYVISRTRVDHAYELSQSTNQCHVFTRETNKQIKWHCVCYTRHNFTNRMLNSDQPRCIALARGGLAHCQLTSSSPKYKSVNWLFLLLKYCQMIFWYDTYGVDLSNWCDNYITAHVTNNGSDLQHFSYLCLSVCLSVHLQILNTTQVVGIVVPLPVPKMFDV